jgi:hypothetical protein
MSYYFTEEFTFLPGLGHIEAGPGSFEIAVEKSSDMVAWVPVVVHNTTVQQHAFYRLRLQR